MEKSNSPMAIPADQQQGQRWRGRCKLLLVLAVCAAPLLASYFTYYVIKPQSRNNYGTLIDPRDYPIPVLGTIALDGNPVKLQDYQGKWVLLQVAGGDCAEICQQHLFAMRQLRLMQGKDMERIELVWLITDAQPLDTMLMREYDGIDMLRVDARLLQAWLPVEAGSSAADHLYMIDPRGNLMMRFPKDADPSRIKKDITKLLRASSIG
jgi:hypothetical protein